MLHAASVDNKEPAWLWWSNGPSVTAKSYNINL